jgi:hypothetical protein
MKRSSFVASGVIALAVTLPASAVAAVVELGATKTPVVAPGCPASVTPAKCTIVLTRVTALETVRDGVAYPTTVKKSGRIVAFTVGLSNLSSNRTTRLNDIRFLNRSYGGTPQAAISVLASVGRKSQRRWKVVATSEVVHLQPYLGFVVQFPLVTSLPVRPGNVVALSTPTWAPVLSILQPMSKFAYRQSRSRNCNNPPGSNQAQLRIGQTVGYGCDYPGTRVEYSATEVTTPPVPKNYVH